MGGVVVGFPGGLGQASLQKAQGPGVCKLPKPPVWQETLGSLDLYRCAGQTVAEREGHGWGRKHGKSTTSPTFQLILLSLS